MMTSTKVFRLGFVVILLTATSVSGQGARYIERQLLCALDQAPCDAWGSQVKAALPEIIGRGCEDCDRVQVNNVKRIARFVQARYPGLWAAIVEKYSNPAPNQQEQYYEAHDGSTS